MGDYSCFFYGTLVFPQILGRVIKTGRTDRENLVDVEQYIPAVLKGFKRHRVFGADYPAIIKNENESTFGVLVKGLTSVDINRLDLFEGEQYVRTNVEVYIKDSPSPHSPTHLHHPKTSYDPATNKTFTKKDYDEIFESNPLLVPAQTYVWIDSPALLEDEDWNLEQFKPKIKNWMAEDHIEFLNL